VCVDTLFPSGSSFDMLSKYLTRYKVT
jgi:hypothetical protein